MKASIFSKQNLIWLISIPAALCIVTVVLVVVLTNGSHTHTFLDWEETRAATCSDPGEKTRSCECGETETAPIGTTEHSPETIPAKDPTSTETGLTEGSKCSVCGTILVAQDVIPTITVWDGTVADSFAGGTGTASDPYLIEDGRQLALLAKMSNSGEHNDCRDLHFRIIRDIYLGGLEWTPIAMEQNRPFSGNFDGNGHFITDFKITSTERQGDIIKYFGLFGYVKEGTIKGVSLTKFVVEISDNSMTELGGLAGYAESSNISDCSASGKVTVIDCERNGYAGILVGGAKSTIFTGCHTEGTVYASGEKLCVKAGGLAGFVSKSTFTDCYSTADVHGETAGGLIGVDDMESVFANCYATGNVVAVGKTYAHTDYDVYTNAYAGGLIGNSSSTSITNCYATGNVSAESFAYSYAGGLIGDGNSTVTNCYATGSVVVTNAENTAYLGGLLGSFGGTVTDCYATGSVNAVMNHCKSIYSGGLVGEYTGTLERCYATGSVVAENLRSDIYTYLFAGGLIGRAQNAKQVNCYATGDVSAVSVGDSYVGGLDGRSDLSGGTAPGKCPITNCYATGDVSYTYSEGTISAFSCVAGLVGDLSGNMSNCLSTGSVTANGQTAGSYVGAFVGRTYLISDNNHHYEGQAVTCPDIITPTEFGTACTADQLNSSAFYTDTLKFDANVWDLGQLDFSQEKLPTLKQSAS